MQNENYTKDCKRTLSDKFHPEGVDTSLLVHQLHCIALACDKLDKVKKHLFYGKDCNHPKSIHTGKLYKNISFVAKDDFSKGVARPHALTVDDSIQLLHGLIGKITEAGELASALQNSIVQMLTIDVTKIEESEKSAVQILPIDFVNVVEEVGDGLWYDAIALDAMKLTINDAQFVNIEKLKKRFPDKFTEDKANKRDVKKEFETLENSIAKTNKD